MKSQAIRYTVLLAVIIILPFFFKNELSYYLSILSLAGIYAIAVIGLNLLMGYAGQISLGHAGIFCSRCVHLCNINHTVQHLPAALFAAGYYCFRDDSPFLLACQRLN